MALWSARGSFGGNTDALHGAALAFLILLWNLPSPQTDLAPWVRTILGRLPQEVASQARVAWSTRTLVYWATIDRVWAVALADSRPQENRSHGEMEETPLGGFSRAPATDCAARAGPATEVSAAAAQDSTRENDWLACCQTTG